MVKLYCKALMEETTLYNSAAGWVLKLKLVLTQEQGLSLAMFAKNYTLIC